MVNHVMPKYLFLELRYLNQEDPVPVVDDLIDHPVPVIRHLPIQNLTCKSILRVLY